MNKAITHGLIAGLATVIIGCFDNRCAYEETGELRFRALLELNSWGETGNTCTYPTDIPFGIWALSLPVNKTWNNHADGAQTFLEDCRVIWNGETWITDTTHNWPPDRRVTFFAYSPYRFPATFSTERGIEFKNFNTAADSTDLMFSGPIVDLDWKNSGGTVQIPFTRALCMVDFRVQTPVPSDMIIRLKKIALEGVAFSGNFQSLPEATWSETGDTGEAVFFEGNLPLDESEQQAGGTRLMMPQQTRVTVKATCDIVTNGNTLAGQELETDATLEWGTGKHCSYTLKITPDTLVFTTDILKP